MEEAAKEKQLKTKKVMREQSFLPRDAYA